MQNAHGRIDSICCANCCVRLTFTYFVAFESFSAELAAELNIFFKMNAEHSVRLGVSYLRVWGLINYCWHKNPKIFSFCDFYLDKNNI